MSERETIDAPMALSGRHAGDRMAIIPISVGLARRSWRANCARANETIETQLAQIDLDVETATRLVRRALGTRV